MIAIGTHVLWERFEVNTCADIAIWWRREKKSSIQCHCSTDGWVCFSGLVVH